MEYFDLSNIFYSLVQIFPLCTLEADRSFAQELPQLAQTMKGAADIKCNFKRLRKRIRLVIFSYQPQNNAILPGIEIE